MSISPPPPPPPETTTTATTATTSTLSRLIRTTLSYDTNVMLAAIISLLLVILFVLLLHLYTRWFLQQARRRSHSSVAVPRVLGSRLHQRFTVIDTTASDHSNPKLGLPFSTIASLPLFVYKSPSDEHHDHGLDCAICLSVFEDDEIGRRLPACGHAFHVECIDMWLHSHSTCPICRSPIQCNHTRKIEQLEVEITDPERNSTGFVDNDEQLRLEIVESDQSADVAVVINDADIGASSSSSIRESPRKLITASSSCSSRSGGKVHPLSIVNGDEV